jgi:hypothetical protein
MPGFFPVVPIMMMADKAAENLLVDNIEVSEQVLCASEHDAEDEGSDSESDEDL